MTQQIQPVHRDRHDARSVPSPPFSPRALGLLLLFGLTCALGAPAGVEDAIPDNPLEGRKLFEEKGCNTCHGFAGKGQSIGPNLTEGHFKGSFLDMGAALWNHAPAMSATFQLTGLEWPRLSEQESRRLLSFLYFLDYLGRPGQAGRGQAVFSRESCSSCHVIGGGRGRAGPDLMRLERFASPLYVAQEIWNHGPSMFESMQVMNVAPPSFQEGDLADLSAYIRQKAASRQTESLLSTPGNPNHGRQLFVSRGCAKCHGATGRGTTDGPDLTRYDLHRPAETIAGIMWNHALGMNEAMQERSVSWPKFENTEFADLVSYLYFLAFEDKPGDTKRGERVFAERSCSECHSAASSADRPSDEAPNLTDSDATTSPAALVAAMWNHAPIVKKAILGHGRPWPELSGQDLRDLQAFLQSGASPKSASR